MPIKLDTSSHWECYSIFYTLLLSSFYPSLFLFVFLKQVRSMLEHDRMCGVVVCDPFVWRSCPNRCLLSQKHCHYLSTKWLQNLWFALLPRSSPFSRSLLPSYPLLLPSFPLSLLPSLPSRSPSTLSAHLPHATRIKANSCLGSEVHGVRWNHCCSLKYWCPRTPYHHPYPLSFLFFFFFFFSSLLFISLSFLSFFTVARDSQSKAVEPHLSILVRRHYHHPNGLRAELFWYAYLHLVSSSFIIFKLLICFLLCSSLCYLSFVLLWSSKRGHYQHGAVPDTGPQMGVDRPGGDLPGSPFILPSADYNLCYHIHPSLPPSHQLSPFPFLLTKCTEMQEYSRMCQLGLRYTQLHWRRLLTAYLLAQGN